MMKTITKEEVWIDRYGAKHYSRVTTQVSDDEYYTRKYCDSMHRGNFDKIFEAYEDYIESNHWD